MAHLCSHLRKFLIGRLKVPVVFRERDSRIVEIERQFLERRRARREAGRIGEMDFEELHIDEPHMPEKSPSQHIQEDFKLKSDAEMTSSEHGRWEGGVDMTTPSNVYHLQRKLRRPASNSICRKPEA